MPTWEHLGLSASRPAVGWRLGVGRSTATYYSSRHRRTPTERTRPLRPETLLAGLPRLVRVADETRWRGQAVRGHAPS